LREKILTIKPRLQYNPTASSHQLFHGTVPISNISLNLLWGSGADSDPGSNAFTLVPLGSGSRMNYFRIPDLGSFLHYLQNHCYVVFMKLGYS
jgi:hypothetical protein